MAKFNYTALNKEGKKITGTIEASNASIAARTLQQKDLRPITLQPFKSHVSLSKLSITTKKVGLKDLVIFTRQLSTMINAGVPLAKSLATLRAQTENETFKKCIAQVSKDVEGGMPFADAIEKHPQVFSPIYINMVRAGEAGGILDTILKKLALQQEKDARIRGKFKSAMTYPAILFSITIIVFMILMVFVMPRIGSIIKDLGGEDATLPILTQIMLAISGFMVNQWYIMLILVVGGTYLLRRYIKTPAGRQKKDELLLKLPVLSMIIRKVAIARFARTFASLIGAGVTVIESLEVTAKAIGNTVIEKELMNASEEVTNGSQLSEPLANSKVFPPIVSQMMAIGEETGQTGEILVKVADFYEEEVDATVDSLSSILEPIMIVVMGVMVGLIAASVIGPISNLSTQI